MKSSVILLLLLQVFTFKCAVSVNVFDNGKIYVYEYKARSATGVSEKTIQLSGFGFESKVTAQKSTNVMQLHMKDLKLGSFNKKVDNAFEEIKIDYNRLTEQSQEHNVNLLENAFYAEFEQGVFKAIHFRPNEDIAKHNNKKALAALFQLHLHQVGGKFPGGYITHEDSWDGVCDTTYAIDDHGEELTVTKLRNYENCTVQPHLFHSSILASGSTTKEQYAPVIKEYSEVQYKLKKSGNHYVIESVYAASVLSVSPFASSGQTIFTVVNQTLTLLEVRPDAPDFLVSGNMEKHETLYHQFNQDKIPYQTKDVNTAHYYDRVFKTKIDNRLEKADELYKKLEEAVISGKTKLHEFVPKFVKIFQSFSYEDFGTFIPKLEAETAATKFTHKILPYVGTNPAIKYMLHWIAQGEIQPASTARSLIQRFPFYVKEPTKQLIDVIKTFYKQIKSERPDRIKDLLAESTLLAYGTVVYRGCKENVFNPHPIDAKHYIPQEQCAKYVQELIEKFNQFQDLHDKIHYFHALINIDTEEAHEFLSKFIESKDENRLLRIKAMWAAGGDKETILSIMMDPEEDHVTRIYAMDVLLHNGTTSEVFGKLLLLLNSEPSQKFRSHIYETMKAYAKPSRRSHEFHDYAKYVLKYAEHHEPELPIQTFLNFETYFNAKYNYGRTDELWVIPDAKSSIPRDILISNQINVLGHTIFLNEIFFSTNGAPTHEEYIAPFVNHAGLLPDYFPVSDDLVLKTINKFNFKSGFQRRGEMQFYNRILTKEAFVSEDIQAFIYSLFPMLGEIEAKRNKFEADVTDVEFVTIELIKPNALGMPVYLTLDIPATHHLKGHLTFSENQDSYSADVDVKLKCDATIHAKVYVHSLLFGNLGFELQTDFGDQLPVKGSAVYDSKQHKPTIKYLTPPEPKEVFYYKTTSKTFDGDHEMPLHFSPKTVHKKHHVGYSYFGAGLTFNVTHDEHFSGGYRKLVKSLCKDFQTQPDLNGLLTASKHFMHYALMNPTGEPFEINVIASRCTNYPPTTEFQLEADFHLNDKDFGNFKTPTIIGHRISTTLTAKGPVERKWELSASASFRWPQMDNPKIIAQYKRAPIPMHDTKPFEVCFNGKSQTTDDYWKIFNHVPVDIKQESRSQFKWGETCDADVSTANIKTTMEKSEEQKTIDTSNLDIYKKCKELVAKGYVINYDCWKVILDLGRLDKITHNIDYSILPKHKKSASTLFKRFSLWFRHTYYDNLYIDYSTGSEKPDHLELSGNISYYHPEIADFKVVYPHETAYYKNVYKPNTQTYTVAESCIDQTKKKFIKPRQPICIISGNFVRTFDGLTYEAPLKNCHYLAFSEHYWNKTFIYFSGVKTQQYTLAAKIYLKPHVIEFIPNDATIDVTVDGQKVLEGDIKSYYLPNGNDPTDSDFLEIFKQGKKYVLLSQFYGLRFFYTGRDSYIKASHLYRGKQLGLCGNFDGESYNDLQGPDGTDHKDATTFATSFAVEDNCK